MIVINKRYYTLLLSFCPCEIFEYYGVNELHGLNYNDCKNYDNTESDAYIAGWSNFSPVDGSRFVFINLSRCVDIISTVTLVNHELLHLYLFLYDYNLNSEEEIITHAEKETKDVAKYIINKLKILK